jgi:hypothetical protein
MAARKKIRRNPDQKPYRRKDYKENPEELLALIDAKNLNVGRPIFKPEYIEQARKLYKKGFTDFEVADFFGVTAMTIRNWVAACPEFGRARRDAKDVADEEVKWALYNRARGYDIPVEKVFCKDGVVTRVESREHIPADPKAAKYWLENRDPDKWKTRREVTGANGEALNPSSIELVAPKRPLIEIARMIVFTMQRATDEQNGGPQPLLIEEKAIEG